MRANELYKIVLDDQTWNWTSGDTEVVYNGDTYTPMTIGRTEVEQGDEINRANITLSVPRDNPVGAIYLAHTPDHPVSVTIFRQETELSGSPDSATLTYWKGRIAGAKASGSQIEISCESVFTSLRRFGLRARYQRGCRHALYHRGCTLDRADFAVTARVSAISGVNITVPEAAGQADGWYLGGMLEFDGVLRFIVNHVGQVLTLQRVFEDLNDAFAESGYGMNYGNYYGGIPAIRIYPGCDRTRATCNSKFNNLPNHGGFDWIPNRNPFDGRSIV